MCGNRLAPQPTGSGKDGYTCRPGEPTDGCGKIRISAAGVEDDVGKQIIARLVAPGVRERLLAAATGQDCNGLPYADQLAAVKAKQGELTDEWTAGTIPRDQWVRATQTLVARERELEQLIGRSHRLTDLPVDATIDALSNWWQEEADLLQRRDLVLLFLDHINVMPATKRGNVFFDKDRVTYIWRTS
jgi:hypothetical protein